MPLSPISERLGNEHGVEVFDENEAIYFGMDIRKLPNEFADRGNIAMGRKLLLGRLHVLMITSVGISIFQYYRVAKNKRTNL